MPVNTHLDWAEVKDFAPGLWQVGDWLVPATAAQELVDAYPQAGGGLRAFFKPSTVTLTGIGSGERIIGLYGILTAHRTLPTLGIDFYCVTYKTADLKPRLYRFDGTDATQTGWTVEKTFAAATDDNPIPAQFVGYTLSGGALNIVLGLRYDGADVGIWYAPQSSVTGSQTWTKITGTAGGPITIHQNRLVEARSSVVWFTGPGDLTFAAPNFVNVEPQRNGSQISVMIPSAPGDLIVGTYASTWSEIQGDLTDPTVRTMSDAHFAGNQQHLADTGQGIAFIETNGGVYLTDGGVQFSRLDSQLLPFDMTGVPSVTNGDLSFFHHWLMTPNGTVFDFETKSWFRTSFVANDFAWVHFVERSTGIYLATNPATNLYRYDLSERTGARCNSFTWKSAPLRAPDGRQIEVREIQLVVKSYVGTSSVTVTVNGTARTISSVGAGSQSLSFLFRERAEVLDVTVASSSGDTSHEAPSIEVLRIGSRGGHLTL